MLDVVQLENPDSLVVLSFGEDSPMMEEEPEHPRRLATIQTIENLTPIEGADFIECAQVLGWYLVTKKGEFKIGDPCVFFEIDSLLPDEPVFEFMRNRGFRVKTVKFKRQISQGLALPMDAFKWGLPLFGEDQYPNMGDDVTEHLGVKKWEPKGGAKILAAHAKGNFPAFLRKTDEERIQNCFKAVSPHFDHQWEAREKLDGSSVTYYMKDGEFGVCSRNLDLKLEGGENQAATPMVQWARDNYMAGKMALIGGNFALQGEIVGPGIQKNKYGLEKHEVYFFNYFDIEVHQWGHPHQLGGILEDMGLKECPYIDTFRLVNITVSALVAFATRKSLLNPKIEMEGIVCRPVEGFNIDRHGRASFKVLNPKFLLKYDE